MVSEQQRALAHDRMVDITTIGRRSGQPRRIEIWFHNLDGGSYVSGLPGRRGWYANVVAHPDFVFNLKETARADIRARAHPVTDAADRRRVLSGLVAGSDARAGWKSGSIAARSSRWNCWGAKTRRSA